MKTLNQPSLYDISLTAVLQALSEPIRMKIVQCLHKNGEQNCVSYKDLHISKSTLSHHFKVLREAGVVKARIEGTHHYYSIRLEELEERFPGVVSSILLVDHISSC